MSGYINIKHFDDDGKNMSSKIEDDDIFLNILKCGTKLKGH